jgi:hypothetical protein
MVVPRFLRHVITTLVLLSLVLQGTMVLAGTTGTLTGVVEDAQTKTPIAGAKVTVASPSQTATATTDASGRFSFLSLGPDTYLVSVEKSGYDTATLQGVTIIADNVQTVTVDESRTIREIGRTTSRASSSLLKPGTTADVYSVTPAQQDAAAPVGGGGTQNSAFSALATVPGVFVQPNQAGYIGAGSTISIRGGDYNQIGYEIDGIPVNRAYDSYPSGPSSSLGQQELQVYTGAAPANAEAQGLSGFINQVIKTGTYPGGLTFNGSVGTPSSYNKLSLEFSGATPDRNFTYYLAAGGYFQRLKFVDQFNGTSVASPFGQAIAPCNGLGVPVPTPAQAPSCYVNGAFAANGILTTYYGFGNFNTTIDRDNIANLHWLIPRANGQKDDIQLLGMVNWIRQTFADSTNDNGGAAYVANVLGTGPYTWADGRIYTGQLLQPLGGAALLTPYYYPYSQPHAFGGALPAALEGDQDNQQALVKLGWTHPFSDNLIAKIYGYTYYGSWWNWDPNTFFQNYTGLSANYNVQNHTSGVSGSLIGQFGSHTLTLLGSFTNTNTWRFNDATEGNSSAIIGDRVSAADAAALASGGAFSGLCYSATGAPASCFNTGGGGVSIKQLNAGTQVTGAGCPGGCVLVATDTGYKGSYNDAQPRNQAFSLTDQWQINSKLTMNYGIRLDNYGFVLPATTNGGAARQFWYTAYNQDYCTNAAGFFVAKGNVALSCAAQGLTATPVTNQLTTQNAGWLVWQPRIGFTYRLGTDNVLRASYGRYSQAPNDAFEQYDAVEADAPARLYNTYGFQLYGFTTPSHPILPQTSDNLDFSWEHQFHGTDMAIKISPFLRKTQNQIQQFFLNQQTNFVSGLNVGNQTAQGFEFEFDKGDFGRNGWAAKASFTYTNSYIRYSTLPNGGSLLSGINNGILQYNAYTKACAPGGSSAGSTLCGGTTATGVAGAPCYTTAGAPDNACLATSVANPYWNAPIQNVLNVNGNYPAYDIPPGAAPGNGTYYAYGAPYVATLLLQYKHDKLAITPALQFYAGQKYSSPMSNTGIAPDACTGVLGSALAGDPRYNYGAVGGKPYDATTCGTLNGTSGIGGIPDPATGTFDTLGQFTAPANLQLHLQVAYDVSKKMTLTATFANLWNSCFGGSKVPWNVQGACGYTSLGLGSLAPLGNAYNPGTLISPYVAFPYIPTFGGLPNEPNIPFTMYLNLRVKT